MVKILANGDIVPDDDPRVKQNKTQKRPNVQPGYNPNQDDQRPFQQGQQINIFQTLNQRLLDYGVPRWNMGNIVIEPLVLVGLLVALLFFGLPGLIFGIILFAVCSWSQNGAPDFISRIFGNNGNQNTDRNKGRAGDGHRLGR